MTDADKEKIHDLSEAAIFLMDNPDKASEVIRPIIESLNESKRTYDKISKELHTILQQKTELENKLFDILTAKGRLGAIVENLSTVLFSNMSEEDISASSNTAKEET